MSKIIKFFAGFKSIFTGKDVLKENEEHANIVVATTMLNIFITAILIYILTISGLFNVNKSLMLDATLRSVFTLFIPAIVAFILKGKGKYLKYLLIVFLTISIGSIYSLLTYTTTLLLIVPILLAARYYSKKFTIFAAIISIIMLGFVEYLGVQFGLLDLNYVELPKGTTIVIETNIEDAVKNLDLNKQEIEKYIMLQSYLPKLFIYSIIIVFACVQISQSGKNMIKKQKELSEEGSRIEAELNLANAIQKNMLPSIFPPFPEHEEIDIYAEMIPAKEVGGDFYDMFLIDENHLGMVIADVSGKGVPAALIMMITKTLIMNTALNGYDVDEVFDRVNKLLYEKNALNHFVTSWFGILNLKTGNLEFVNAGHNPPLIYTKKDDRFEFLTTKPNLILAAMENIKYKKHEVVLEPGDKLFLYTDGVTESTNEKDELYGEERLQNYLNNNSNLDVKNAIKGVKGNIDNFVGHAKQFDDITMLELFYKKKKSDESNIAQMDFKADITYLPNVQDFIESKLEENNCNSTIISQINLCVEEIFVNISSYAYKEKTGTCRISVEFKNKSQCKIIFEDSGIPFNPLEKEETNISLPLEERPIGGLGILLVKKTMDNVEYKYENNKNILILTKTI